MEQRDQGSLPPAEDIGRAAAEAAAQAEAGGGQYSDSQGHYAEAPKPRGSRRWLVTAGVAVSALALAGTATAIATHTSHPSGGDTTENAAAAQTAGSSTPPDSAPTSGTAGTVGGTSATSGAPTTPATGTSAASTASGPASTSATTSPKQPATSPKTSATKSPAPPAGTDEEGGDCENTSHSTQEDQAAEFSGMKSGAQHAFTAAKAAAKEKNLAFVLNSGYRSAAYQERIFECWVKELGSPQAARKYALPPNESAHVMGYAMDIAPPSAAAWLESTKGQFGLCRRYADETWHFEYQVGYKTKGCPALLPHP